jgi:RimJ/RimL family protein N-acetyltransferase
MIIGGSTDLETTVSGLMHLRRYAPFRYGGRWFVAFIDGKGFALRSLSLLLRKAREANLNVCNIATIDKEPKP